MKIGMITDETDTAQVGLGTYASNIALNILKLDTKNDYYLIHRRKEKHKIYSMGNDVIIPYNGGFPFSMIRNFITLPIKLRMYNFDIVHHTGNIGPFLLKQIMPTRKGKTIQTLFDIIPLIYPETFEPSVVVAFKHLLPKVLKNADMILAISEKSKQDAIKRFGIEEEKIEVTYMAPNEKFVALPKQKKQVARTFLKERYGISGQYILFTSALEAKKNVPTLLKSFSLLKNKGLKHKLVLVGKKGYKHEEIFATINKLGLQKEVIMPGYTPLSPDLVYLYNCADVFVLPSVYEGFGIPVTEAMKCGCPVVASNGGSLPEVAGKAGLIVDANDVNGYADAIEAVINDARLREKMIRRGFENAKRFSWEKSAKKTIEIYERLGSSHR